MRYPVVEALSGALFGTAAAAFAEPGRALAAAALFWFLLVLSAIDLDTMRLPNVLVAALAVLGAAGAGLTQLTGLDAVPVTPIADGVLSVPLAGSLAGAALGAGTSLAIALVYAAVRRREGFGMGDVKLLGAMGLFLGPYVIVAFFAATVLGAAWGLGRVFAGSAGAADRTPFGPFLGAGGVLAAVFGPTVVTWYLVVAGLAPPGAR